MRNAMQRVRCSMYSTLACFLLRFKLKKKREKSMRAGTTRDAVATEQVYFIYKKRDTQREKREARGCENQLIE